MFSSNFKGRYVEKNTRVKVYRNLINGLWSVLVWESKHQFNNKVVAHFNSVTISTCTSVSPVKLSLAGQARARRAQIRNVHAYLVGGLVGVDLKVDLSKAVRLSYVPFIDESFVVASGTREAWDSSECVYLHFEQGAAYAFNQADIFIE